MCTKMTRRSFVDPISICQRAHEDALARVEIRNSVGEVAEDNDDCGWVESDSSLAEAQLTGNYDRNEGMVTKVI